MENSSKNTALPVMDLQVKKANWILGAFSETI
jgi:hypothetical protein